MARSGDLDYSWCLKPICLSYLLWDLGFSQVQEEEMPTILYFQLRMHRAQRAKLIMEAWQIMEAWPWVKVLRRAINVESCDLGIGVIPGAQCDKV